MWILIPFIFLFFDAFYITPQMASFQSVYHQIQKSPLKVRYTSALVCYLLLSVLLYSFILKPKRSLQEAFLLGFCVYGVYDATTYALLKDYPLYMACMDTLWGGILFVLVTYVYRLIPQ
jgi:uncharacterized membrane protein